MAIKVMIYEERVALMGGNQRYICLMLKHSEKVGLETVLVASGDGVLIDMAKQYGQVYVIGDGGEMSGFLAKSLQVFKAIRTLKP